MLNAEKEGLTLKAQKGSWVLIIRDDGIAITVSMKQMGDGVAWGRLAVSGTRSRRRRCCCSAKWW